MQLSTWLLTVITPLLNGLSISLPPWPIQKPYAPEGRAVEWGTLGHWVRVARIRVSPFQGAVQSDSRDSQNKLSFAQQTSQDNPRLSFISTTLKKEEKQIFWVNKQNLKILTIHFSKTNIYHNLYWMNLNQV